MSGVLMDKSKPDSEEDKWVGTWATALQQVEESNMPPEPGLSNNTLRQVVRVSLGGNRIRVKFSNEYGNSELTLNLVQIAVSSGKGKVKSGTEKLLTFEGKKSVTIPAGGTVTSDTVDYCLPKLTDIAITIYFGNAPTVLTGHPGSRTTSYILPGNGIDSLNISTAVPTEHWYVIAGIDVITCALCNAVVALGDSITDGRGSTTDMQNRWTDNLAKRLQANTATAGIGVLNMGIGGNTVLQGGLGPSAVERFERDVLSQSGVRYLIIFEGVNDIGINNNLKVTTDLINTYKSFIDKAHANNILVYGATILPFGGSQYDSAINEQARQTVNDWIRTSGEFDAVIDFDAALRDTKDFTRLKEIYDSGDHLHPNAEAYKKMAEIVELDLFAKNDR